MFKQLAYTLFLLVLASAASAQGPDDAPIVWTDVQNFWSAYDDLADAATWSDSMSVMFDGYYRPGSDGLHDFVRARIGSVIRLLDNMTGMPGYYASIRESTLRVTTFDDQVRASFREFEKLSPGAKFPTVYYVIGRTSSGGTTTPGRILIGTEMYGLTPQAPQDELNDWLRDVLRPIDDVPGIVAHELIHTQQNQVDGRSLLRACIREGSADFLGEMISGQNINAHVHEWADPREAELWDDFQKVMLGEDRAGWLYSRRADDEPNDLGYWIGYKITQSYYENASDKMQAIADMLNIQDFEVFLEASGYNGGR